MKRLKALILFITILAIFINLFSAASAAPVTYEGNGRINMEMIAHYDSGSGEGGTEIVQYAPKAKKAFVVNGAEKSVDILDLSKLASAGSTAKLTRTKRIGISDLQGVDSVSDITSVAVSPDESLLQFLYLQNPKQIMVIW